MNSSEHNPKPQDSSAGRVESVQVVDRTLRLIAHPPVPEGLEERVQARLDSAPRNGRLLAWPVRVDSDWMRTAAAAAIVAIVAGSGWGVYTRAVQPRAANAIVRPAAGANNAGGFSSAGAMRTPQTLNGPVMKHPAKGRTGKLAKKADGAPVAVRSGQADATRKPAQSAADAAAK